VCFLAAPHTEPFPPMTQFWPFARPTIALILRGIPRNFKSSVLCDTRVWGSSLVKRNGCEGGGYFNLIQKPG